LHCIRSKADDHLLQINESVKTLIEGDQQVFIYRRWFVLQKVPEASIISNIPGILFFFSFCELEIAYA
jgi:hypothetical protein